ncbi:hypothetical protein QVD17_09460 [Tagetes erecta]|uniref:Uncharacterized protein n=1 Tax=Tagetes erecta TaxID=13708 RepID=A0AAD8L3W3_TARER|nr:hypothetical protein QVD17_09460 [Tagetes erecta]
MFSDDEFRQCYESGPVDEFRQCFLLGPMDCAICRLQNLAGGVCGSWFWFTAGLSLHFTDYSTVLFLSA